ncbi:hypothetical protein AB1Y20_019896 [Prymnesium parvum]|uniref:Uncharacterized protein n=1 Tax=Prymnesium parvum TaxID=97485 RepID=A0AB34JS95_PRYPA
MDEAARRLALHALLASGEDLSVREACSRLREACGEKLSRRWVRAEVDAWLLARLPPRPTPRPPLLPSLTPPQRLEHGGVMSRPRRGELVAPPPERGGGECTAEELAAGYSALLQSYGGASKRASQARGERRGARAYARLAEVGLSLLPSRRGSVKKVAKKLRRHMGAMVAGLSDKELKRHLRRALESGAKFRSCPSSTSSKLEFQLK